MAEAQHGEQPVADYTAEEYAFFESVKDDARFLGRTLTYDDLVPLPKLADGVVRQFDRHEIIPIQRSAGGMTSGRKFAEGYKGPDIMAVDLGDNYKEAYKSPKHAGFMAILGNNTIHTYTRISPAKLNSWQLVLTKMDDLKKVVKDLEAMRNECAGSAVEVKREPADGRPAKRHAAGPE